MEILVIAALVVAAVSSPLPDDSRDMDARSMLEVQKATACFMAAWNAAAARGSKIQSELVDSGSHGHYVVKVPQQVQVMQEVQRTASEFIASFNEATRCSQTVTQAVSNAPQTIHDTADVKRATEEFMAAWEAAAHQASSIQQAISNTGTPEQVHNTEEVKRATAEFMTAWEEAVACVPKIESTMYTISGTVATIVSHHTTGYVPHFTPSIRQATAEFLKAWNSATAAASGAHNVNIIMESSSHVTTSHSDTHQDSASVIHHSSPSNSLLSDYIIVPQPFQPTVQTQQATASFMVSWNKAAAEATTIISILVQSSAPDHNTVMIPKEVEETEEIKRAIVAFTEAWNEAANCASTVKDAIHNIPQPIRETEDVEWATTEFMEAWLAAAQKALTMRQVISNSGVLQQVEHADAVKRATEEFIAAWKKAVTCMPLIEPSIYTISGTVAAPDSHHTIGYPPQFTPLIEQASTEFLEAWNDAEKAADVAYIGHLDVDTGFFPPALDSEILQPTQPTAELQQATAAFMIAWNKAAAMATAIHSFLLQSSLYGYNTETIPQQGAATNDVMRAITAFMAAWNEAASCASTVETAIYNVHQPDREIQEVRMTITEFIEAWQAAAQQASTMKQAISLLNVPQQVEPTDAVKKAIEEFMAAWEKAVVCMPKIEPSIYSISGTVAAPGSHHTIGNPPQFTPSLDQAPTEFIEIWNNAENFSTDVLVVQHIPELTPNFGMLQPVQSSTEVQQATAALMATWNKATALATAIYSILVYSSTTGNFIVAIPKQVDGIEEIKRATTTFLEFWDEAAGWATTVENAIYNAPETVRETKEVISYTTEFIDSWEAAAKQASAMLEAISSSGVSQQVDYIDAIKKATEEFVGAWEKAAACVPKIESTMYIISGTVASPALHHTIGFAPEFTPSLDQATAEFIKAWNATAALDMNIILGSDSISPSIAGSSFNVGSPKPVGITPEIQSATYSFMAAWNAAAEIANIIQGKLYKFFGANHQTQIQNQASDIDAVRKAIQEFMAAWNAAAQLGVVVEQAILSLPQQIQETAEVKQGTAEFMLAWYTAAQQASVISQVLLSSSSYTTGQPMDTASDIERATADFIAAWNEAAARIPKIETAMYTLCGSSVVSGTSASMQVADTPEVTVAQEAFMDKFHEAEIAALHTPILRGLLPVPTVLASAHVHTMISASASTQEFSFNGRLFTPVAGLPQYVEPCNC